MSALSFCAVIVRKIIDHGKFFQMADLHVFIILFCTISPSLSGRELLRTELKTLVKFWFPM